MKTLFLTLFLVLTSLPLMAQHHNHAKHNMVMFGESEVFVSHIVYKVPHNYQVILKLHLDENSLGIYRTVKLERPNNTLILLLDHMEISKIAEMNEISGTMLMEEPDGARIEIKKSVKIKREHFEIIFFDEVPLNLSQTTHH